jgi:hypothetical protein
MPRNVWRITSLGILLTIYTQATEIHNTKERSYFTILGFQTVFLFTCCVEFRSLSYLTNIDFHLLQACVLHLLNPFSRPSTRGGTVAGRGR